MKFGGKPRMNTVDAKNCNRTLIRLRQWTLFTIKIFVIRHRRRPVKSRSRASYFGLQIPFWVENSLYKGDKGILISWLQPLPYGSLKTSDWVCFWCSLDIQNKLS